MGALETVPGGAPLRSMWVVGYRAQQMAWRGLVLLTLLNAGSAWAGWGSARRALAEARDAVHEAGECRRVVLQALRNADDAADQRDRRAFRRALDLVTETAEGCEGRPRRTIKWVVDEAEAALELDRREDERLGRSGQLTFVARSSVIQRCEEVVCAVLGATLTLRGMQRQTIHLAYTVRNEDGEYGEWVSEEAQLLTQETSEWPSLRVSYRVAELPASSTGGYVGVIAVVQHLPDGSQPEIGRAEIPFRYRTSSELPARAMSDEAFRGLLKSVQDAPVDESRVVVMKAALHKEQLTVSQLKNLLGLLLMESSRVTVAVAALPRLVDRSNAQGVTEMFRSSSSRSFYVQALATQR